MKRTDANLPVITHLNDDYCEAEIVVGTGSSKRSYFGRAKRHPLDTPDDHTATLLAQGRAFRRLGNAQIRAAQERVRLADKAQAKAKQVKKS